jgi:3-hydroxyisobutyrate dehydrogenase
MAIQKLPQIGFCGLGAMGGGMASNLVKRGFSVHGYDLYSPLVTKLVEAGGHAATSPFAAAQGSDFLILMVVNSAQADTVLFDEKIGAVKGLRRDATIILCSTTAPQYQKDLRAHLDGLAGRPDIKLLDCPVSGGSIRAANGTLSIFSSGADGDLNHAAVVLEAMSDPLYRIPGGISMGSVAKMCHQHQAAVNIIMSSEAMGLAAVAGLNTKDVYEAIIKSKGWSWMFENRGPHMLSNDWLKVHSAVSIIVEDSRIVTQHADAVGFPLALANTALQLYIAGMNAGFTKDDDAGLVRLYLPADKQDAVGKLATESSAVIEEAGITIETIADIMAGVHLASTRECMNFAKYVGMDVELLTDIVARGAGASKMFDFATPSLLTNDLISLKAVPDVEQIRDRLESGLQKARKLQQPMSIAAAALEEFNFYLR